MIGLGAGPGAVRHYRVDAPYPWGPDTDIAIPVDQMVDDTWTRMRPKLDAWANDAASAMANTIGNRVEESISRPLSEALDSGTVVVERVQWTALLAAAGVGFLAGIVAARWF